MVCRDHVEIICIYSNCRFSCLLFLLPCPLNSESKHLLVIANMNTMDMDCCLSFYSKIIFHTLIIIWASRTVSLSVQLFRSLHVVLSPIFHLLLPHISFRHLMLLYYVLPRNLFLALPNRDLAATGDDLTFPNSSHQFK